MSDTLHTVVLYHRGCNDGTASAWVVEQTLGSDGVAYRPYQYGDPFPEMAYDTHVILVDLSLRKDQIDDLIGNHRVKSILVIDHHKSAIKDLRDLPVTEGYSDYLLRRDEKHERLFLYADTTRCGAVLCWLFFNNIKAEYYDSDLSHSGLPEVLRYIEDYDLWKHSYAETKAINAWLINGEQTIDRFKTAVNADGVVRPEVIEAGNQLLEHNRRIVRSVLKNYVNVVKWGEGNVAFINGPHHLRNELADAIIDDYLFVVIYNVRDGKVVYSLRSKSYDVTRISSQFGGGGHANAGAFAIDVGNDYLYPHQFMFGKPSFMRRLQMAWKVLKGWPR